MSYTLLKTDGSTLTQLVDGTIDQTATSITLIGKDSSNYGSFINENFIYLLENFANTTSPGYPIVGQLWFDTTENRLKVYDGTSFKVSGGTIVQEVEPASFTQGDMWIDSYGDQLHFYDGTNLVLAGPVYTTQQGISGFSVEDVIDTNKINRTIVKVYVAQVLIGILSNSAFTPLNNIPGFSGSIGVGFTVSNYSGIKFDVPVSQADYLLSQDGTAMYAESFVSANNDSLILGTLTIQNDTPLVLGQNQDNEIVISSSLFQLNSNIANQNFGINLLNSSGLLPGLFINSQNEYVGIYTNSPGATLDVNGNAVIRGNLTVEGSTTTINTTNVNIEDLIINLGAVNTPSNSTANGGGIVLEGGTDGNKSLLWDLSTTSWKSSENINLLNGKGYYVNGFEVLSQTALGSTVTSAPGLSTVGILSSLQVANLSVTGSTLSFTNSSITDGTIFLAPKNAGTVDVGSKKITNLAAPSIGTDAANLSTVNQYVQSAPLGLASDTTGLTNAQIASQILANVYPAIEHTNNTICRIYCINSGVGTAKAYQLVSGVWTWQNDL